MRLSRRARYTLVGLGIVAAWMLLGKALGANAARRSLEAIVEWATHAFGELGERGSIAVIARSLEMAMMAMLAATLAAPLGMLVRAHARTRLRATGHDVLASLRRHVEARSWRLRVLSWVPAAIGVAITTFDGLGQAWSADWRFVAFVATMPAAVAVTALVRRYLALLSAPPARDGDLVEKAAGDEDLFFSAVAVTPEARGLVTAFAAANLAFVGAVMVLPVTFLHVAVYAALAIAGAIAYRSASRIAVGLDGVLVTGTSRQRFFAYRDLATVGIASWGEVVLASHAREVLRLQLVGDDAPRMSAIVARIQAGIDRARDQAGDVAQRFAETANAEAMARAAHGRVDYRGRAASREDLLALVESPATDATARAAAASALGQAADASERQRLRVAAGLCAEPEARAVLLRVAASRAEEDAEAEAETAPEPKRATMSR